MPAACESDMANAALTCSPSLIIPRSTQTIIPTAPTTDLFAGACQPPFPPISSEKAVIGRGRWYNSSERELRPTATYRKVTGGSALTGGLTCSPASGPSSEPQHVVASA